MKPGGLRQRRSSFFVRVPRATIRDRRISYRARGILSYLLDMPAGWDVKSVVIAAASEGPGDGREAVRTALRELGQRGYYRLERIRLRDGRNVMGTAISEEAVPEWAEQWAEFEGKAVRLVEQVDGTLRVQHRDGTLSEDGFGPEDVPPPTEGEPDDHAESDPESDRAGDGFSGPGSGDRSPGPGSPGAGFSGPLRENETGEREGGGYLVGDLTTRARPTGAVDNLRRGTAGPVAQVIDLRDHDRSPARPTDPRADSRGPANPDAAELGLAAARAILGTRKHRADPRPYVPLAFEGRLPFHGPPRPPQGPSTARDGQDGPQRTSGAR